ncbi:MAG: beta-propeller fold lactonase family protein [bacterium]
MVANQHSNNVVIFQRDLSRGSLSKFLEITDVESPVSARFIAIPETN